MDQGQPVGIAQNVTARPSARHGAGKRRLICFSKANPRVARSTLGVTSPFPASLRRKTLHIHRPADFPDVYANALLVTRPYDAILDVFPALQPVPGELPALRLSLACSGRPFSDSPFSVGHLLRSLRGGRHE